jgi:hypothetical protein
MDERVLAINVAVQSADTTIDALGQPGVRAREVIGFTPARASCTREAGEPNAVHFLRTTFVIFEASTKI